MKIRIVRHRTDRKSSVEHYRIGLVYDLPPIIANYLVAEGFAVEMRPEQKSPKAQPVDLRKFREFINEHREGKKIRPS